MTTEQKGAPRKFVYCGQRSDGKTRSVRIAVLTEDGSAVEKFQEYAYKRTLDRSVGSVYVGASFDEKNAYGLHTAKWEAQWDVSDTLQWEAENAVALERMATAKLEADATRISELERLLAPIRKQYAKNMERHDHAACGALEAAVLKAIRSRPRSYE